MDVRKQFVLSLAGLGIVIIFLLFLVFLGSTNDPISEDNKISINPLNITSDDGTPVGFPNSNEPTLEELIEQEEALEGEVIATVTLEDKIPIAQELETPTVKLAIEEEVVYKIVMKSTWSEILQPTFYPNGAHLSPMVAWAARSKNTVFREGGFASAGLEIVAETGAIDTISEELTDIGNNGLILDFETGKRIDAPGTDSIELIVGKTHPYVSVVSMIAPSPDWILVVDDVVLLQDGEWVQNKKIDAILYDAGTDNGETFNARNSNTDPQEPITKFIFETENIPALATFEFILLSG